MNDNVLHFLKNSWVVLAIVIMIVAMVAIKKFDFSLSDYLVDKVIQKIEANYSPYGPKAAPQGDE